MTEFKYDDTSSTYSLVALPVNLKGSEQYYIRSLKLKKLYTFKCILHE